MKSSSVILIIIAMLVVAGGAYWLFVASNDGNEAPISVVSGSNSQAQQQFQMLFGELSSISFDLSIFKDSRFGALVDITIGVTQENQGRTDPFAIISNTQTSVSEQSKKSATTSPSVEFPD